MSDSTTYPSTICLDTEEGTCDCPAIFDIEIEEYLAEPHSWGRSRGIEIEAKAKLLSATLGGLKLDRAMCIAATGAEHIERQECRAANTYIEEVQRSPAAA